MELFQIRIVQEPASGTRPERVGSYVFSLSGHVYVGGWGRGDYVTIKLPAERLITQSCQQMMGQAFKHTHIYAMLKKRLQLHLYICT